MGEVLSFKPLGSQHIDGRAQLSPSPVFLICPLLCFLLEVSSSIRGLTTLPPLFDGSSNPGRHTSRCHGAPPFPSPPPWADGQPEGDHQTISQGDPGGLKPMALGQNETVPCFRSKKKRVLIDVHPIHLFPRLPLPESIPLGWAYRRDLQTSDKQSQASRISPILKTHIKP